MKPCRSNEYVVLAAFNSIGRFKGGIGLPEGECWLYPWSPFHSTCIRMHRIIISVCALRVCTLAPFIISRRLLYIAAKAVLELCLLMNNINETRAGSPLKPKS